MTDLAAAIPVGARAEHSLIVTQELTVGAVYPDMPAVFATPQMICLMEQAAADAVHPFLPAGWVSVGTRVDVQHLAATPVGMSVTATAEVIAVDARSVRFRCTARDADELIGTGEHERGFVELERFMRRSARKQAVREESAP